MAKKPIPILIHAVLKGDADSIDALARSGVDVEQEDSDGRTALHHAAIDARVDIARILVRHGAAVSKPDVRGWTPLHFAAQGFHVEVARMLIEGAAVIDAEDEHGNTPLWRAVFESRGRGDMIQLLRSASANKDKANRHGVSPAALAQTIANYPVAQFLK